MARIALALLLLASLSACHKVQARTPAPSTPLSTPTPPDRLFVPVQVDVPEAPPVTPPAPPPVQARPASSAPPRPQSATPPPAAAPVTPPQPEPAAPVLQTTADVNAIEQQARDKIEQAKTSLAKIVLGGLGKDAQGQYNVAKRYAEMAQDALKNKNYPYALELAKKAAAMAGLLVKGH